MLLDSRLFMQPLVLVNLYVSAKVHLHLNMAGGTLCCESLRRKGYEQHFERVEAS